MLVVVAAHRLPGLPGDAQDDERDREPDERIGDLEAERDDDRAGDNAERDEGVSPGVMAVGDELSVYVDLLKQGRTSLRLKAEAIARERDGEREQLVAEGEFTFVALDENHRPRPVDAQA